jgi:hypothetical protein
MLALLVALISPCLCNWLLLIFCSRSATALHHHQRKLQFAEVVAADTQTNCNEGIKRIRRLDAEKMLEFGKSYRT